MQKKKLMHIYSTSPSVADFDGSEVLSYWKELSKKEDVKLFGYSIPSIYNVSRHELSERMKYAAVKK